MASWNAPPATADQHATIRPDRCGAMATPAAGEWCADRARTRDGRREHITLRNQHQRGFGCAPTPERRDTVPVALWDGVCTPPSRMQPADPLCADLSLHTPSRAFAGDRGLSHASFLDLLCSTRRDSPAPRTRRLRAWARTTRWLCPYKNDLFAPAAPGCSHTRRSAGVLGCGKCTCFLACAVVSCCDSLCGRHQGVAGMELQVGRRAPMGVECYGALS